MGHAERRELSTRKDRPALNSSDQVASEIGGMDFARGRRTLALQRFRQLSDVLAPCPVRGSQAQT